MRIVVDRELCEGNERCMRTAPEVFRVDDDGVLHLLMEQPTEELRDKVTRAVGTCPRGALSLEED